MTVAYCNECGAPFRRGVEETWKKRCVACWLLARKRTPKPARDPLLDEFEANLHALIQLSHPDRHGGSALATRVTSWLLQARERLSETTADEHAGQVN